MDHLIDKIVPPVEQSSGPSSAWQTSRRGSLISPPHPHIQLMTKWQPAKREPAKTRAELREMLAEAVRNTQVENKRLQRAKKDRGEKVA